MNKPIYRHLAHKKWSAMKRKILMQRITQMHVVPDVLPAIDPVLDVDLIYHRRIVDLQGELQIRGKEAAMYARQVKRETDVRDLVVEF